MRQVGLAVFLAVGAWAQDGPRFEVASIKPAGPDAPYSFTGPVTGDPGRIAWTRIPLRELILNGYPEYWEYGQRISGPSGLEDEYAVSATIPPGSSEKDVTQMLQNLLNERFGLKFHEETKEVQGFELVVGEHGLKLANAAADADSTPPSNGVVTVTPSRPKLDHQEFPILASGDKWRSSFDRESGVVRSSFRRCSMKSLANMLSNTYGARSVPVIDKTENQGLFDFHLVLPIPSLLLFLRVSRRKCLLKTHRVIRGLTCVGSRVRLKSKRG